MSRRSFLNRSAGLVVASLAAPQLRAKGRRLRFGVGPFMPTVADTRRSFTPLFAHVAKEIGVPDYDLAVSSDWAGLAVASGQVDLATDFDRNRNAMITAGGTRPGPQEQHGPSRLRSARSCRCWISSSTMTAVL